MGISGEIRIRIIRYRSRQETVEGYFAKIESVRDSLGNIWTPATDTIQQMVKTGMTLRIGDTVDFVITATDPLQRHSYGCDLVAAMLEPSANVRF